MKKIIILLFFIVCMITSGCVKEESLDKYGIKDDAETKTSEVELSTSKLSEIKNDNNKEKEEKNKNAKEYEVKYPISSKIESDFMTKNEKYLSEIVDILNTEYYLGKNTSISERERDELNYELESKIDEYIMFISDKDIGEKEIDNGYTKYTLNEYLDYFYYNELTDILNYLDDVQYQKSICKFISRITLIDYINVVNERSKLIGKSIYKPEEILDFICNNEEINSTYIDNYSYSEIKEIYGYDSYNISNFMKLKLYGYKEYSDDLKNKLVSYLDTYEKWVNSFENSKSIINNEERYYNESEQISLYDEMKIKIENINTLINDIYIN